jgi:Tetratricopeptide repeat.
VDAYTCRGLIAYHDQGRIVQAISDFTKAIEIDSNCAEAYAWRSIAYYGIKEYDKARADVHEAEKLGYAVNPKFLDSLKQESGRDK